MSHVTCELCRFARLHLLAGVVTATPNESMCCKPHVLEEIEVTEIIDFESEKRVWIAES